MNSIRDILIEHNIPLAPEGHKNVRAGWIGIDCPFCGEGTRKFHLGIPENGYAANCWQCGKLWIVKAMHALGIYDKIDFGFSIAQSQEKRHGLRLPPGVGPLKKFHHDYLKSRGFSPTRLAKTWALEGIGLETRLAWTLFIPIHHQGRIVSWTTRSITDNGRRYVNARPNEEEIPAKRVLYGGDYARHAIIVVEGPTDAWRIGPGAVATMGLSYTRKQLNEMSKFSVRAIAFDNEKTAQERARRLCNELSALPGKTVRVEIDAADPGSMSAREVESIRRSFLDK